MLSLKQLMTPIWDTDVVWAESLTFVRDECGNARAPLLYKPESILCVTSANGMQTYQEYVDFVLDNNEIVLTKNSRIFAFDEQELYPSYKTEGVCYPIPDGYLKVGEGHFFHDRQIAVSYTCDNGEWEGIKPQYQSRKLPYVTNLLKNSEPIKIMVYGDSICVGANSSGITGTPPFQAPYFYLLCDELRRRTGSVIEQYNPSVGGKNTDWAIENADELVLNHDFDLLILAFGMNDGDKSPDEFESNIRKIVNEVKKKKTSVEIILVSTSTPNPLMTDERAKFYGNQYKFKHVIEKIAKDIAPDTGIAVANITDMQKYLHSRKRFIDTTGNNVNHPNDFFYRLYAQYIVGMLLD